MLRFFEAAEFEFLRTRGVTYASMDQYSFPRVHVECDYKGMVRVDDLLSIRVSVELGGRSSFSYCFTAFLDDKEVASGKITVVCLLKETMRPNALPEHFTRCIMMVDDTP